MNTPTTVASLGIKEIAFTAYPVTDMARARAFYENVLGLTPSVVSEHDGKAWIEYDVGAGTIAINNLAADKWRPTKDGPSLAFEVADFQSAVDSLRASGAIFYIEPISTGVCQFTVISDPDGNSVTIHQRNSK